KGPDLARGVPLADVPDGSMVGGHELGSRPHPNADDDEIGRQCRAAFKPDVGGVDRACRLLEMEYDAVPLVDRAYDIAKFTSEHAFQRLTLRRLAERAGLKLDRGVAVNEYLETSVPGIFAAGDIARWPDPHTGENLRIEHWVVAERQGQTAARNILGQRQRFSEVPFFWSQHYDVPINYIGHAETWDDLDIEGNIEARDCLVRYRRNGKVLAVASIFRDVDNLKEEAAMKRAGLVGSAAEPRPAR